MDLQQTFHTDLNQSVVIPREPATPKPRPLASKARARQELNARYELAERSTDMNEQFARATSSSGRSSLDAAARSNIRDRVRHEMHEANPWMHGSARTTVNWVIGRGPWLEVKIDGDQEATEQIQRRFNQWFRKRVHGPRKLRTMCWGMQDAGAGMALITNNPSVRGNIKLDFVPFEDDHVRANPSRQNFIDRETYFLDGKEEDEFGNPVRYFISEKHPAEHSSDEPVPVSAEFVIDVFTQERASQGRGVSPYVTSAKNGPLLRSFRRATLDAATTAAKLSYLLKTQVDRFDDGDELFKDIEEFLGLPLYYGEGMALPKGWEPQQLRAEHPNSTHDEFLRSNVSEMGRGAGQPGQITLGDSRGMNFASGQLGRQDWELDVDVQRQDWEELCLDRLLEHWLVEAALTGEIPAQYADIDNVPHEYRWSRRRHQDTNREYSGRAKAIATGQTSRQFWQTDDGLNPEAEDEAAAASFGVDVETYRKALFFSTFKNAAVLATGEEQHVNTDDSSTSSEEAANSRRSNGNGASQAELDAIFQRRIQQPAD